MSRFKIQTKFTALWITTLSIFPEANATQTKLSLFGSFYPHSQHRKKEADAVLPVLCSPQPRAQPLASRSFLASPVFPATGPPLQGTSRVAKNSSPVYLERDSGPSVNKS